MIALINPKHMDPLDWCDRTGSQLAPYIFPLKIENPEQWREWGEYVLRSPVIAAKKPPHPDQFERWEDWAARFNSAIANLN